MNVKRAVEHSNTLVAKLWNVRIVSRAMHADRELRLVRVSFGTHLHVRSVVQENVVRIEGRFVCGVIIRGEDEGATIHNDQVEFG